MSKYQVGDKVMPITPSARDRGRGYPGLTKSGVYRSAVKKGLGKYDPRRDTTEIVIPVTALNPNGGFTEQGLSDIVNLATSEELGVLGLSNFTQDETEGDSGDNAVG